MLVSHTVATQAAAFLSHAHFDHAAVTD
jgi:hypothetical protein